MGERVQQQDGACRIHSHINYLLYNSACPNDEMRTAMSNDIDLSRMSKSRYTIFYLLHIDGSVVNNDYVNVIDALIYSLRHRCWTTFYSQDTLLANSVELR